MSLVTCRFPWHYKMSLVTCRFPWHYKMSLVTCRFSWHYKMFVVTYRFPDITKSLLFNTWVFSDNTKGLVKPEWWGLCGIMSTGWRLTSLNLLSLLIIDKAQPICTWSPENKEIKMSCRIWCCWDDDCKDLLVDNCLTSSEQYFSYIQEKTKCNNK